MVANRLACFFFTSVLFGTAVLPLPSYFAYAKPASKAPVAGPKPKTPTQQAKTLPPARSPAWKLEMDEAQTIWNTSAQAFDPVTKHYDQQFYNDVMARVEQHLRHAVELAGHEGSLIDQAVAVSKLGECMMYEKHCDQALEQFQQSLYLRKRGNPVDTIEVAECYDHMAMCKSMNMQDKETMIDDVRNSYEISSKLIAPDDARLTYAVSMLAEYASSPAEAVPFRRQDVAICMKNYGDKAPGVVGAKMFILAIALGNSGRLTDAVEQGHQAIEWTNKQGGSASYSNYMQETIDHWQRQMSGAEPPWNVVYHSKYAGRNPRSKPDDPNPPTVATSATPRLPHRTHAHVDLPYEFRPHHHHHHSRTSPGTEPEETPVDTAVHQPAQSPVQQSEPPADQPAVPPQLVHNPVPPPASPVTHPTVAQAEPAQAHRPPVHTGGSGERYYAAGQEVGKEVYDAMVLSNEACELLARHKFDEARSKLSTAVALDPDLSSAHANLGLALAKLGQMDEALEQVKRAVQLEPTKSSPLSMLASVYQSKGQVDEAIDTYKQYLDKFPNESDVAWVRSLIANLQKVSDSQKAVIARHPGADKANDYLPFCTEQSKVRWRKNHGPVKVYIQSGSGVKNFQPAFEKSLRDSFSDWVTGTGGVVSVQYVSSKREADIDCLFTDNFGQVSSLAEGGETKMLYDGDGNFEHCSIVLLTAHATDTLPPSENEIRGVCLHEIGHSLGLTGHSPNASDIMYCSETDVESKRPQLSSRDLATLKKLYG